MSTPESRARARRAGAEAITIIGAGPTGRACAIALARAGRRVAVREWHRDVGARFRGDFQGLENWSDDQDVLGELAKADIQVTFEHHSVSQGTAYDSLGNQYMIRSERPLFYLVRRGSEGGCLDHALLNQAAAAGVEVSFEDRVSDVQGATILAIGPRLADVIAVGYVFETDMGDGNGLALDSRLAPLGYAYRLIHGGRGTVASCMFTGFKRQAAHVERTVAFFRERVGLKMHNPRLFGGFANFRLSRAALQGGHPAIGEQAGFQDALAGFGIRYALRSGLIAARGIIEGTDYTALWHRELLPLLRTGIVNRFLFALIAELGWRFAWRRLSVRQPPLTSPIVPDFDTQPDSVSGRTALLPSATARSELRPHRLPVRLVSTPERAQGHGTRLQGDVRGMVFPSVQSRSKRMMKAIHHYMSMSSTRRVLYAFALTPLTLFVAQPSSSGTSSGYLVDHGIAIYYAVIPAEMIRGHSKEHVEATMHGEVPASPDANHIMVALFDASKDRARIAGANVTATVGELGLAGEQKRLEPFTVAGALTYGNYFDLRPHAEYRVRINAKGRVSRIRFASSSRSNMTDRHESYAIHLAC